ncbi:hypothetical protein Misp06_01062 [Microbulbifer sp. NBRC 101763]
MSNRRITQAASKVNFTFLAFVVAAILQSGQYKFCKEF